MGKPTSKMVDLAKEIAKRCDIELDEGILEDFDKTKEFIDEHINTPPVKRKLTAKQIEAAKKAGGRLKELAEEEWLAEEEMEEFHKLMDEYFASKTYRLSEKQIEIVKKNAPEEIVAMVEEKEELPAEEFKKVREWLDEYFDSLR